MLTYAILSAALTLPAFSRDVLLVTTNWSGSDEQVLLIDPEFGHVRTLWHGRGGSLDALLSPDGRRLYVTHSGRDYGLSVIDTTNGAILQTVEGLDVIRWIRPNFPAMAISPDGRRLYLLETNYSEGPYDLYLRVFDTQQGRVLATREPIRGCAGAELLPFDNDAGVLLLCQRLTATPMDTPDFVLNSKHRVQGEIVDGKLYAALQDGRILEIDPVTRQVLRTADHPSLTKLRPVYGTLSPDSRLWYLPIDSRRDDESGSEHILVFDIRAMRVVATITPNKPFHGLALSSDGKELYAAAPHQGTTIAVIDTATHRTVRTLSVGAIPYILQVAQIP